MGSIARRYRAERFIEEFEQSYVNSQSLKPGMRLEVVRLGLGYEEGGSEQVKLFLVLRDEQGSEHEVGLDTPFDPEHDRDDDLIERVAGDLVLTEDQARQRLKKADLL
jgi:hypothetical protein